MGETLKRCARSLHGKESTDDGAGLVALDGRLFAVPRGYGSAQIGLDRATALRDVGPLEAGDVVCFLTPDAGAVAARFRGAVAEGPASGGTGGPGG